MRNNPQTTESCEIAADIDIEPVVGSRSFTDQASQVGIEHRQRIWDGSRYVCRIDPGNLKGDSGSGCQILIFNHNPAVVGSGDKHVI